jgi:hypothetical protein
MLRYSLRARAQRPGKQHRENVFIKKNFHHFLRKKKCQFRMVPTVWASLFAFFRDGRNLSFCTCIWLLSTQLF